MKAVHLRTIDLLNPMGIGNAEPVLSWTDENGTVQKTYEIEAVDENGKVLWNSGKVMSSSMHAVWQGNVLSSRQHVSWKVRLSDEAGEGEWSEPAWFETGLLSSFDWKAEWISGNYKADGKKRWPVDCFLKKFDVSTCVKARLYITACGLYEAHINGQRAGTFIMAPGYTDYRKRIQYQTYDVSDLLKDGLNTISVDLADGWYRGSCGAFGLLNQYGKQTKLLAQLEWLDETGRKHTLCTDDSWLWSNDGPVRFADNKDGETVDARMVPSYSGYAILSACSVIPSASDNVPVEEHEAFHPDVIMTPSGRTILDFHQNIAGYVSFTVSAHAGQKVSMRFGEMLDENGEFSQKNIQTNRKGSLSPLQQIDYACHEGVNTYKPRFTVFGFQYVLLETDAEWKKEDFTAIAVYSSLERTGFFYCSDDRINRFFDATVWSAKNNSLDIPTDCPTRERHGWTGDAQVFFNTASYLFQYKPFMKKYLNDVFDWQRKSGRLPEIAPEGGSDWYMWVMNGSVGWSDIGILAPYRIWKKYGDDSVMKQHYEGMKKFAEFEIGRIGKWGGVYAKPTHVEGPYAKYAVNCGQSYGEWAEPNEVTGGFRWYDFATPHPEVSTAYTSYAFSLMAEMSEHLGYAEDMKRYRDYAEKCRLAYQALRHADTYPLDTDRQAELVRPLYLNLLDEKDTAYAKKRLIEALEHYDWKLGTGFLSTPFILDVLCGYDPKAAYRLLENPQMPGWLYMPINGATTIWESWEGPYGDAGTASLDHYSKGAMVEWLFHGMCGINMDSENHFVLKPVPGGSLMFAKASYASAYGEVKTFWKKENGKYIYSFTVPSNTTASIVLPDGSEHEADPGTYQFETEAQA